jgi:cysteine desulfurase
MSSSTVQPNRPVYLDYAATTPVDPRVVAKMIPYLSERFGNPASRSHAYGWAAEEAVELAREQVSLLIGADPREIVWTSGATESNNLAIKGAAQFLKSKGRHLVTLATEHKAVLDTLRELEREGWEVTVLPVLDTGLVDIELFKAALRPDTVLASVMFVNNETGVIQDIDTLGNICRSKGVIFHVDAAQATGKVTIDLSRMPIDLMSMSAHKSYGPKGIGALYVRHAFGHPAHPPDRWHGRGLSPRRQRDGHGDGAHPQPA